ncbi:MAG TPA: tRNA (adenosine(37)-N6)-threonylcarbamoyltransferase complex dimerization subunit type 1 TsaB [Longimicrobiales bacterium]
MEPYLAIETSTAIGGVAVGRGERLLAEVVVGVQARHSEAVLPAVEFALRAAGVPAERLAGVVVGGGPGSFTGVRLAAATAKGLIRALGVPLFAYSGLAALAAAVTAGDRPVCALFDARRGEVYAACYRFPGFARMEAILGPVACRIEDVLRETAGMAPIFAGDGALRYRDAIERAGGAIAPPHAGVARASALLWLADLAPEAGRVDAPADWEPLYLRAAGSERGAAARG